MNTRAILAGVTLVVSFAIPAGAAGLPPYVKLPANLQIHPDSLTDENFGEANMPVQDDVDNVLRGRHIHFDFSLPGVDESTHEGLWKPLRASLTSAGWTLVKYFDTNPPAATLHYQKNGIDAWFHAEAFGADDYRADLIESKKLAPKLVLAPPAPKPESIGESQDFPYLEPMSGHLVSTDPAAGVMTVLFKGDAEPTIVASQSVRKSYEGLDGVSNLQFVEEYRGALTKAGWQIVEESQSISQGDAVLVAHYANGGRELWATLHYGGGEATITVADGGGDLAAALQKNCRLPLYGITFDFNKAAIRPSSEGTLQRVAAALTSKPQLNVEIAGHTDNVGGDDANLKLSQARAESVRAWLTAHGIAAARLTARGYGRKVPVADNGTPEGRAKNRRVELVAAGCK